jgi:hypothetical protein
VGAAAARQREQSTTPHVPVLLSETDVLPPRQPELHRSGPGCGLAVEGQPRGRCCDDVAGRLRGCAVVQAPVLALGHVLHQVRDYDSVIEQPRVVLRLERLGRESCVMEQTPEPVARPGVVVATV